MRDIDIQVGSSHIGKCKDSGNEAKLPFITPEDLEKSDEKTRFYTGFISFKMFMFMFNLFCKHGAEKLNYWDGESSINPKSYHETNVKKSGPKRSLRPIDEFLMMCMKLCLNLLQQCLADMFNVSMSTVSHIFEHLD